MAPVLFSRHEIDRLRELADGAAHLQIDTGVDPVALLRVASSLFGRAQLVVRPDGRTVAGLGAAWIASSSGINRFAQLRDATPPELPDDATILTGFSFHADGPRTAEWEGFNSVDALVPEVSVTASSEGGKLTVTAQPGRSVEELIDLLAALPNPPDPVPFDSGGHSLASFPPPGEWRTEVEEAVAAIAEGAFSKVVLSRSVVVTTEAVPKPFELVDRLRHAYPQCYLFVWQSGDAAFIGATPELLVEKAGQTIRLNPLAGTARRGEGEVDDRDVGESLLRSSKDRSEHSLVVDDIAEILGSLGADVTVPQRPSLRRMATVQHLSTEISGTVDATTQPLDLVAALHPTPAVGGSPRQEALAFLDKVEGIDRGWYAGGIGWYSRRGDALFAVPLRCALIRRNVSLLHAGAGIVAGSDPDSELEETRLKFRPMLGALTAT